jgi:hypothetical protein
MRQSRHESRRSHTGHAKLDPSRGDPKPSVDDVPGGKGVLVQVLRVGVDGTDKEINDAESGAAPPESTKEGVA